MAKLDKREDFILKSWGDCDPEPDETLAEFWKRCARTNAPPVPMPMSEKQIGRMVALVSCDVSEEPDATGVTVGSLDGEHMVCDYHFSIGRGYGKSAAEKLLKTNYAKWIKEQQRKESPVEPIHDDPLGPCGESDEE